MAKTHSNLVKIINMPARKILNAHFPHFNKSVISQYSVITMFRKENMVVYMQQKKETNRAQTMSTRLTHCAPHDKRIFFDSFNQFFVICPFYYLYLRDEWDLRYT